MKPREIYDAIEAVWKEVAVQTMALELIVSGTQAPNPASYAYEAQHSRLNRLTGRMRTILDELERLGKEGEDGARADHQGGTR